MYNYYLTQWIIIFFFYCFLGWIWESNYVSIDQLIKNKKWKFINRGFLHGPIIPIYGSAAIFILIATSAAKGNVILIYLFGAISATIMELGTGTIMEQIFKVKYWDYSNFKFNYKGYISLYSSLFWGFLSVLLVEFIHVFVNDIILYIPINIIEIAAIILTIIFIIDVVKSIDEAMDLSELIDSITENNKFIQKIENRVDATIAFSPLKNIEIETIGKNRKEIILNKLEKLSEEILDRHKVVINLITQIDLPDKEDIVKQVNMQVKKISLLRDRKFIKALAQLKRNKITGSEEHKETIELLSELLNNEK